MAFRREIQIVLAALLLATALFAPSGQRAEAVRAVQIYCNAFDRSPGTTLNYEYNVVQSVSWDSFYASAISVSFYRDTTLVYTTGQVKVGKQKATGLTFSFIDETSVDRYTTPYRTVMSWYDRKGKLARTDSLNPCTNYD